MRRIWNWISIIVILIVIAAIGRLALHNSLRLNVIDNLDDYTLIDLVAELDAETEKPVGETLVERANVALAEAEQAIDLAFSLLGLFEAFSLVLTVGGVVVTAFGLTRFTTARNELEEARRVVEEELEDARNRFETAFEAREAELRVLRNELQETAQHERQRTSDALLANALIPLAERQYRTTDYRGAIATYKRALSLDPFNPVINQRLGYVYTQSGSLELAREHYERAIEREQDFAFALAGLGFVMRRFGEKAGEKLDNPDLTDEERLTATLERDQLLNRAEELLLQALTLSPKLVDDDGESYWGILGGLYKRRGQIDSAIQAYQKVIEFTPQSSYGYGNLALLYQKKNDREKMRETYRIVEQIASKEADAEAGNFWGYSDLIVSSYAIGKIDQAQEALPVAISIAPQESPYMLEGLADTLRELRNVLEADDLVHVEEALATLNDEIARRERERAAARAMDDHGVDENEAEDDEPE